MSVPAVDEVNARNRERLEHLRGRFLLRSSPWAASITFSTIKATTSSEVSARVDEAYRPRYSRDVNIKATVRDGRLVIDEPTDLPEGTVVELVVDDGGDNLGEDEHEAIRSAIAKSLDQASRGRVAPAGEILATLPDHRDDLDDASREKLHAALGRARQAIEEDRLVDGELEEHEHELDRLRAALVEGETSGPAQPFDVETFIARMNSEPAS